MTYNTQHRLEVRDHSDGTKGVYSARAFKEGDVLSVGYVHKTFKTQEAGSICVGENRYVALAGVLGAVMHSGKANCMLRANDNRGYDLIALRDGERNEELTRDHARSPEAAPHIL